MQAKLFFIWCPRMCGGTRVSGVDEMDTNDEGNHQNCQQGKLDQRILKKRAILFDQFRQFRRKHENPPGYGNQPHYQEWTRLQDVLMKRDLDRV